MMHPWPKEVALSLCSACGLVRTAKHVNQEDRIPDRFCARCGKPLDVAVYRHERELAVKIGHPTVYGPAGHWNRSADRDLFVPQSYAPDSLAGKIAANQSYAHGVVEKGDKLLPAIRYGDGLVLVLHPD